jgi:hypothetical protein
MENPQSFTARRSAASNLPTFQLPPPDIMHKYPGYPQANSTGPPLQAVASVLTPPAGVSNDLSPLSSGVNSSSSGSSTTGIPPYNPPGYWQPQNPAYTFNSAPQGPSYSQNPLYMNRQLYSPGMNYNGQQQQQRSSNSPLPGENLPPPPYEINQLPFPVPGSMNGSNNGQNGSLPALAPQQQQQQMANLMMNSQQPASQAPQQTAIHAPDNYGGRPPPTPTYSNYPPSSTPQQSSFPAYTQPSPTQQSPITSGPPQNRISPVSANHPASMQPPQGHYSSRPYNGYPLPAMSGPIMSNIHSPGGQMALVGGMNMQGYPPQHMGQHNMYGAPHGQQQQNDRPFKCDQCPQSFNRNHDLKRHKRIHLAVKPFPCTHCEKSFSRKDALKVRVSCPPPPKFLVMTTPANMELKRHILVKGCGKTGQAAAANAGSQSPLDKSEVMSDSTDDGPEITKKEH